MASTEVGLNMMCSERRAEEDHQYHQHRRAGQECEGKGQKAGLRKSSTTVSNYSKSILRVPDQDKAEALRKDRIH